MTGPTSGPSDDELLARVAAIHALIDPPPPDLADRVLFTIDVHHLEMEVARLIDDELVGSGARASERTSTLTFDAPSRTIMITVSVTGRHVRADGWLAPQAALRVELRFPQPEPVRTVTADAAGRFVFDEVPPGPAQLLVHPPAGTDAPVVVTPSFVL